MRLRIIHLPQSEPARKKKINQHNCGGLKPKSNNRNHAESASLPGSTPRHIVMRRKKNKETDPPHYNFSLLRGTKLGSAFISSKAVYSPRQSSSSRAAAAATLKWGAARSVSRARGANFKLPRYSCPHLARCARRELQDDVAAAVALHVFGLFVLLLLLLLRSVSQVMESFFTAGAGIHARWKIIELPRPLFGSARAVWLWCACAVLGGGGGLRKFGGKREAAFWNDYWTRGFSCQGACGYR